MIANVTHRQIVMVLLSELGSFDKVCRLMRGRTLIWHGEGHFMFDDNDINHKSWSLISHTAFSGMIWKQILINNSCEVVPFQFSELERFH